MEDINKMYVDDLRALAKKRQVPGADGMKKAELIAALEQAAAGSADPDRRQILFRQFPPGSEPVTDGEPASAYTPEADPQAGEPDPPAPAGKVGAPIGAHRSPKQVFADRAAEIDQQMTDAERQALTALQKAGWQIMILPQVENAWIDTAVQSFRIRGRYDIGLVRQKLRR